MASVYIDVERRGRDAQYARALDDITMASQTAATFPPVHMKSLFVALSKCHVRSIASPVHLDRTLMKCQELL
jgi:hypothetical protein